MATGKEFMAQLETRFAQLSVEERLDKIVEYQKHEISGLVKQKVIMWRFWMRMMC